MNIYELKMGQSAIIDIITGDDKLLKRLLALGCIQGTKVTLRTLAPFGDPLIISLRGFELAIRKKDAKNIFVKAS